MKNNFLQTNKQTTGFITLLCFLFISTLISCKEEKEKKAEPKETKQFFCVEITAKSKTTDDFTVYYTEDNTNQFDGAKAVWKGINGGLQAENIVFDLPEDIIPTNIRLDFGVKPESKKVEVENIKISFYDQNFFIKGSDFFNYFIKNDLVNIIVNETNGTIIFENFANKTDAIYFYPRQELLDEINKITN